MINSENIIVVTGMAHSGTTILTYLLQQHPEIVCYTDGGNHWILENDILSLKDLLILNRLMGQDLGHRLLLKKPGITNTNSEWLQEHLSSAYYVYCLRPFDEIVKSWNKKTTMVDEQLRNKDKDFQRQCYNQFLENDLQFGSKVKNFSIVEHEELLVNPVQIMKTVIKFLGLKSWDFDVSEVSSTNNIKETLYSALTKRFSIKVC